MPKGPGDKPTLPCPSEFISYDNYGEARPGHEHAGEDFTTPEGTSLTACEKGVITVKSDPTGYGTYIDLNVGKYSLRYAHLSSVKERGSVEQGDVIALSGNTGASSGPHLHFEVRTDGGGYGFEGTIAPEDYLTGAVDPGGGGGTTSGTGDLGGFSEEDLFAIGRASAFSATLELPSMLNQVESMAMHGAKSIYNDEPLFDFVDQLCKASLREFQSLPNGAFFAFFPDHFGMYGHRKPYWNIDNIEIVDGQLELTDESLATHVFVTGDHNFSGDISLSERQGSKGVVTIYDAFMSDYMLSGRDRDPKGKPDKLKDKAEADNFLKKYGVRPHIEDALNIRNVFFEIFYAYTQFQLLWSNQYRTSFIFTFMPELYPGGVVAFEDHGLRCYIDSVSHSFDYESGFTTQANLSAPAALSGSQSLGPGMIRPFDPKDMKKNASR